MYEFINEYANTYFSPFDPDLISKSLPIEYIQPEFETQW